MHDSVAYAGAGVATVGPAAMTGYLGSFVGGVTSFLGGLATAVVAPIALGVQYIRGGWPFKEVEEPEFYPTQWFNGSRGPMIEGPGTRWFLSPLIRRVANKKTKELEFISAREDEDLLKEFEFRTGDNLEGTIRGQYTYQIPSKQDAYKYFWVLKEPRERAIGNFIKKSLQLEIADIMSEAPDNVDNRRIADQSTYVPEALKRLNGETGNDQIDKASLYNKWGVQIKSITLSEPSYDPKSKDILAKPIEQMKEAQATGFKAMATLENAERYMIAARIIKGKNYKGSVMKVGDIALKMMEMDNNQEIAEAKNPASIVKFVGAPDGSKGQGPTPYYIPAVPGIFNPNPPGSKK